MRPNNTEDLKSSISAVPPTDLLMPHHIIAVFQAKRKILDVSLLVKLKKFLTDSLYYHFFKENV